MPNAHRTVEDVLWLLAENLVEMNRALLDDVLAAFESTDGKLETQAESLRSLIMSNQENLDTRVAFIQTQVAEVLAEIAALKEQVGANELDFSGLDAAIQPLADAVPDPEPEG